MCAAIAWTYRHSIDCPRNTSELQSFINFLFLRFLDDGSHHQHHQLPPTSSAASGGLAGGNNGSGNGNWLFSGQPMFHSQSDSSTPTSVFGFDERSQQQQQQQQQQNQQLLHFGPTSPVDPHHLQLTSFDKPAAAVTSLQPASAAPATSQVLSSLSEVEGHFQRLDPPPQQQPPAAGDQFTSNLLSLPSSMGNTNPQQQLPQQPPPQQQPNSSGNNQGTGGPSQQPQPPPGNPKQG